jgi:hypothetical protein
VAGLSDFLVRRLLGSAISNAAGYGMGGAIQPTLEPFTQELANLTWPRFRFKPLAAAIVAGLWGRELVDQGEVDAIAAMTGYDARSVELLRLASQQAPPLELLLALRRRDVITEAELDEGIAALGYLPDWRARVKAMRNVVPSPTDMVRFAVRETYDPAQVAALDLDAELPAAFVEDAANAGLSPERARQEWRAHWQLPSFEQGLAMMYRGEISAGELDGLLKALDYAPVWRPRLRAIAEAIPPLSDMIRFAVREAYSPAQVQSLGLDADFPAVFAQEAARHGMSEENARLYWRAHWRLPSALQGYRMLWRGLISQAELDALLKALDYPVKWRAHLSAIAHLVPGRIDLKRMLKFGILSEAEVVAGYQRLGYSPQDARRLTDIALAETATGTGGDAHVTKARTSLFNRVHTEFVGRQLTVAEAQSGLAAAGVPAGQVATIIDLWTTESELVRTELTQAQILKAFQKDLYTRDQALAELVERGLTPEDAAIRLDSL